MPSKPTSANSNEEGRRTPVSGLAPKTRSNPFSLAEYLQLSELTRQSVQIEVELDGLSTGHVEIVDGNVWDAEVELRGIEAWNHNCGLWTGKEAVSIMLSSEHRIDSVATLQARPAIRRIWGSTSSLLLEVAVISDHDANGIEAITPGFALLNDLPADSAEMIRDRCEAAARFLTGATLIGFVDIQTGALKPQTSSPPSGSDSPGTDTLRAAVERILLRLCACLSQTSRAVAPSSEPETSEPNLPEIMIRTGGVQCLIIRFDTAPLGLMVATHSDTRFGDAYHVVKRLAGRFAPIFAKGTTTPAP